MKRLLMMALLCVGCLEPVPEETLCSSDAECLGDRICRPSRGTCGGRLPNGSQCVDDNECSADAACTAVRGELVCATTEGGACVAASGHGCAPGLRCAVSGQCTPAKGHAEACERDADCDELQGLLCQGFTTGDRCALPHDAVCSPADQCPDGQACAGGFCADEHVIELRNPCGGDSECISGVCELTADPGQKGACRLPTDGTDCVDEADCLRSDVCRADDVELPRHCRSEHAPMGGFCERTYECDTTAGLLCRRNMCVLPRGSQCEPADHCEPGSSCICGVCARPGAEGACCIADDECGHGLGCDGGTCGPLAQLGQRCELNDERPRCADGLVCKDNICREEGEQ